MSRNSLLEAGAKSEIFTLKHVRDMIRICSQKFLSSFNFSLKEKCVPNILMVSITISTHCIPQTATLTPFRTPISAISHLCNFDLNPEKTREDLKAISYLFYGINIF